MIEILGHTYYIDLSELENFVELRDATPSEKEKEKEEIEDVNDDEVPLQRFSIIKYEVIKTMIEVVLTEREELDDNLGIHSAKSTSIPFRIAFNTLLRHNIIKYLD
tara:strand:+ start:11313 stop:11630 length:318 start_codon:yes stop_codon:yes gene_type:complete